MKVATNVGDSGDRSMATVNIIEDGKTTPFVVHKAFLVANSCYFRAALSGVYEESTTAIVNLADVSTGTFDIFVNWIYTKRITTPLGDDPEHNELLQLWILGDRVQANQLQNQALMTINQKSGHLTDDLKISFEHIYANTMIGSPLRAYIVACVAKVQLSGSKGLGESEGYPRDMLVDIINWVGRHKRDRTAKFTKAELEPFLVEEFEVSLPHQ